MKLGKLLVLLDILAMKQSSFQNYCSDIQGAGLGLFLLTQPVLRKWHSQGMPITAIVLTILV